MNRRTYHKIQTQFEKKMKPKKVNVLGTEYIIYFETKEENPAILTCSGYADFTTKEIHINKETYNWYGLGLKTIRHEIIHCFIYESGLWNNCTWADNEELTDWIAIQMPKLAECFESLKIMGERK